MTVLHLHRPTKFPRKSMSAANMICRQHPNDSLIHKLVWGIISKFPSKEIGYAELHAAVESLKYSLAREKIINRANKLDW